MVTPQTMLSLTREHFPSREVNTALRMYLLWVAFRRSAINTENDMKYSNTLTLYGKHNKGQNKGKQTRKTQTDCSASFEVLHRAYRTSARDAMDLQHKLLHSLHMLCLKPNCIFQTLFDSR